MEGQIKIKKALSRKLFGNPYLVVPLCYGLLMPLWGSHLSYGKSLPSAKANAQPIASKKINFKEIDRKGDWLLRSGRYEEAIEVWRQALNKNPRHVETLLRVGIALSLLQRYPEAYATLNHALEIEPQNPKVLYNLGLLFMRQNQDDRALRYFEKTLKVVNWYPEANYHIGLIYEKRGLKKKALAFYVKEVNNNPVSAKTWQRLLKLKEQLAQSEETPTHRDGFSSKVTFWLLGLLLTIAIILLVRRLATS